MTEGDKRKAHFIGIGGIGISALAQLYMHNGWEVVGTNDEPSPETLDRIRAQGVVIHLEADVKNIAPDTSLVVYSSAWETREPEFMRQVRELGIPMASYFEALGTVANGKRTVAVAGTHGKTTTTGMLAKILKDEGLKPSAIVGSIVKDFESNYLPGESEWFVVEACEYQRHFLELSPEVLVITNIEFDHSDYYEDLKDVQNAFRTLMKKVPEYGAIITDTSHPHIAPLLEGLSATVVDYASEPAYALLLPGEFNQANARAASAAAKWIVKDVSDERIAHALAGFHGTWRRFEYKGQTESGVTVYDDYAHHPSAIKETLRALREKALGRIIVAFHPHLYSRTRDLFDGFVRAFGDADEVVIAPIYAARETDDGSVSSAMLAEAVRKEGIPAIAFETLEEVEGHLREVMRPGDTIMTMGAGDIFRIANDLVA